MLNARRIRRPLRFNCPLPRFRSATFSFDAAIRVWLAFRRLAPVINQLRIVRFERGSFAGRGFEPLVGRLAFVGNKLGAMVRARC